MPDIVAYDINKQLDILGMMSKGVIEHEAVIAVTEMYERIEFAETLLGQKQQTRKAFKEFVGSLKKTNYKRFKHR